MNRVLLVLFLLLLLNISCRKLVQEEFDNFENKITVNSILVQDQIAKLYLSFTDELNEHELGIINNANVEMYNQDSVLISFNYIENGTYISDYIVKENDAFKLKIITDNDSISAECLIPKKTEILHFLVYENDWVDNEGILQPKISFTIPNIISKELYFEAYLIIYNGTADYVIEEFAFLFFDNIDDKNENISKLVKIQHSSYSYPPENYQYQLVIKSVDLNYYKYVKSLNDYNLGRYPSFSNSSIVPSNLFSNIENGYGIFCAYSQTISEIIKPIY